jgi:hypothetical protein
MGTFSLVKEAGEKLFCIGKAQTAPAAPSAAGAEQMAALMMTVPGSEPESQMPTVAKGSNLSKISQASYDRTNNDPQTSKANKPTRTLPDMFCPDQMLRIAPA